MSSFAKLSISSGFRLAVHRRPVFGRPRGKYCLKRFSRNAGSDIAVFIQYSVRGIIRKNMLANGSGDTRPENRPVIGASGIRRRSASGLPLCRKLS